VKNSSVFVLWPYVAFASLLAGTLLRTFKMWRHPSELAAQKSEAWAAFRGGKLWRLSLLVLLTGHLPALLFPGAILRWNSVPARLYALEGFFFVAGCVAVISGSVVVWRQLGRSNSSLLTSAMDAVFLAFLMVGLVSGLAVAVRYRWGSSWGAMTMAPYVLSLLRGEPTIDFAVQMPFLARLHVLSSFAAIAVIPFTRLSTLLVGLIHGAATLAARPLAAAGTAVGAWLTKHNPGTLFWPEED
jgi:nitrate reductase gamma subunit